MQEVVALEFGTMPSWSTVNITSRAWFLGDELLENGIPLANLTAVARHIKQQWGAPTKVYANLCMPSFIDAANQPSSPGSTCTGAARCAGGRGMPGGCCVDTMLPAEIDYVSFDFYSGALVDQQGKPEMNASSPFYCPKVAEEAACVSAMLKKYIYPKLHPHQKAFVVPGLFGAKPRDPAEDAALVAKFESYWTMAEADDHIIGLNPWHYDWDKPVPGSAWLNQFNAGAQQYPKLMAAMMAKSSLLPGLHGNPEPYPHVLPKPPTLMLTLMGATVAKQGEQMPGVGGRRASEAWRRQRSYRVTTSPRDSTAAGTPPPTVPGTVIWRGASLAARRHDGSAATAAAVAELLHAANVAMKNSAARPGLGYAVTDKTVAPPSGSKHDYWSVASYYWPCNVPCNASLWSDCSRWCVAPEILVDRKCMPAPAKDNVTCDQATGLPWTSHDGYPRSDDETGKYLRGDRFRADGVTLGTSTLALGWWFAPPAQKVRLTGLAQTLTNFNNPLGIFSQTAGLA
jgi:hypothetical protein